MPNSLLTSCQASYHNAFLLKDPYNTSFWNYIIKGYVRLKFENLILPASWKTVTINVSPGISTVAVEKLISCNERMVREVLRRAIYRQQYGLRRHLRSDWFAVETVKSMSYELKLAAETRGWLWQRISLSPPFISSSSPFFPPFHDVVCHA